MTIAAQPQPETATEAALSAPPVTADENGPVSEQEVGAIPVPGKPAEAEQSGPISGAGAGVAATPETSTVPLVAAAAATAYQSQATQAAQPQVTSKVAQNITKAISLGLTTMPGTAGGWAKLVDLYGSAGGENSLEAAEEQSSNSPTTGGATAATPAAVGPKSGATGLAKFLSAIRTHESGGNYSAYNAGGGASGAYQFIQSTWTSEANAAGYSQYAGKPAGTAPPSVQDAVAGHMATGYYNQYHTWGDAAEAWYEPADVGKNVVPDPTAGNTESVTAYGATILAKMGQQPAEDSSSPVAGSSTSIVKVAQTQLGLPYQWGGESPGKDFDCSGLTQWVYKQAGVTIPRVAQTQYNATAKIPKTQQLQSGDLLFFGSGPKGVEHVGIYIGNGQMIDAPHTGADVRVETVFPNLVKNPNGAPTSASWADYVGATRPNDPSGGTTIPASANVSAGQAPLANTLPANTPQFNQAQLYDYVISNMEAMQ